MTTDLTAAVDAAAVYQFGVEAARLGIDAAHVGQAWDDAKPAVKAAYRESVLGPVAAAAPVIEAAVREQVAAEIEAAKRSLEIYYTPGHYAGLDHAARIAGGVS